MKPELPSAPAAGQDETPSTAAPSPSPFPNHETDAPVSECAQSATTSGQPEPKPHRAKPKKPSIRTGSPAAGNQRRKKRARQLRRYDVDVSELKKALGTDDLHLAEMLVSQVLSILRPDPNTVTQDDIETVTALLKSAKPKKGTDPLLATLQAATHLVGIDLLRRGNLPGQTVGGRKLYTGIGLDAVRVSAQIAAVSKQSAPRRPQKFAVEKHIHIYGADGLTTRKRSKLASVNVMVPSVHEIDAEIEAVPPSELSLPKGDADEDAQT